MSQTYSSLAPATSRVRILLLAVWAVLTLGAAAFVYACGSTAPAVDEWEFVPVQLGKEPVGPWLWRQHNEHRLPLSRLVYYAEFRLTSDFRASMFLQVAMLSSLALGLMRLASRLRGRSDWTDLFFPISLLHLGHWENFLLGYQICFALFLVLVTGLVVVALNATRETAFRSGLFAGALLFLAALTGGSGLALIPPVVVWLLYVMVVVSRTESRRRVVVLASVAIASVIYLATYFVGYQRPANHPAPSTDPHAIATITGKVLAMAPGVGVAGVWWAVALAEVALGIATVSLLVRRAKDPDRRIATVGLIAVAAGVAGVALAIGIGRAGFDYDMGLWSRYSFLMWPLLCAAFLIWVKAGRKWVPVALCLLSALAFPPNTGTGMVRAAGIVAIDNAMQLDLRTRITDAELIERHFPKSRNDGQQSRALEAIPLLRAAEIGLFAPDGRGRGSLGLVLLQLIFAIAIGRWLWNLGKAVQVERARELFRLQHERFEEQLVKAASASGLPRGLRWLSCAISGDATLVRDSSNGGIVALVPVVIHFEPIEGSDMEDVPAAREPRLATAVYTFARGTWETSGRVVFNHTPEQTVAKFEPQFRLIHHGHH